MDKWALRVAQIPLIVGYAVLSLVQHSWPFLLVFWIAYELSRLKGGG